MRALLRTLARWAARRPPPAADAGPAAGRREAALLRASADAFGRALLSLEPDGPALVAGAPALADCARTLGLDDDSPPAAVLRAVASLNGSHGASIEALAAAGRPCDILARGPAGGVRIVGRTAGALALISLSIEPENPTGAAASNAAAPLLDAYPGPVVVTDASGGPVLANRAWLAAADAADLVEAIARGAALEIAGPGLAREAIAAARPRERVRWRDVDGARKALRQTAVPLADGGAVVWSWDVTQAQGAADSLAREGAAQTLILGHMADAVAIFGPDQRLAYHNPAFARLWELEPAWLAEGPTHAAILDRLRQTRKLPEAPDYGRFRAEELARGERLDPAPEAIWRVAGERTLRVLSLPHPGGGLVRIFSDITHELRLKSQWNQLILVRQATLDKLTDAVAVFGADARLKLRNEAFQRLWSIPEAALTGEPPFDDIVEHCMARLHDRYFWADIKGRITDPDPGVRAAAHGEVLAADGRRMAWQSRPLPDGATLVSFVDVTDARRVEAALAEREAALAAAEQLGRDFVGSVSYELRTPLTTILGYAELLGADPGVLPDRARGWVAAVRAAAEDLARTVEDILAFAELDSGEMSLRLAEIPLALLLNGVGSRWRARAQAAQVTLDVAAADAGTVIGDAARLGRALDHLVEQALRRTPAGGRVAVSARRALGEVCLEVADNGRGVAFHVQAHIFDRFNGDEGGEGGLGLALVKALVEAHGGWVALESAPGAGAVFTCHLPEAGQAPAAPA